MAVYTQTELLDMVRPEVIKRYRLEEVCNLLASPRDEELNAAILDALDDINSYPPQTWFTLEDVVIKMIPSDPRWRRMLYLGAAKNIVQTLKFDWTNNGIDANLGEGTLSLPSRLGDIDGLLSQLTNDFDAMLDRLKQTSQKFGHGVEPDTQSPLPQQTGFVVRRITRFMR